ncbi:MAG: tRNA preQ1(34) S-adenosylmethionine ribosyltransferase-isomerase QueA [Verrucomicrobiota bacterium]|jgi:S-adenosylmethionine:tRNA ribosyltransferase-isomerase
MSAKSLGTSDFDYVLPEELIASHPLERREASRMLVVHREEGRWEHRHFWEFPTFLKPRDLVVLNDTRVIRARVYSDDLRVELLLLEPLSEVSWRTLVKPGRRMRLGAEVWVGGVRGRVEEVFADGDRLVQFESPLDLEQVGRIPLPPYLERDADSEDLERYQTVYSRVEGSVAAPTAGLHFTPQMLSEVPHAFVTLHVGAGTFRPVQVENLEEHPMHTERFVLSQDTVDRIRAAERVVAIGTTTTRVLESCASAGGLLAGEGRTNLFIRPPYDFRVVGGLLTNFHLPKSTLLMLVSAFAGYDLVRAVYEEAIRERYRFYSYGDCMLIL